MKGILIKDDKVEIFDKEKVNYYETLEIDCFDIAYRRIGGRRFTIICDDEALMQENPVPVLIGENMEPLIYGPVIITGISREDGEGYEDLTDEDIAEIKKNLRTIFIYEKMQPCIINCSY